MASPAIVLVKKFTYRGSPEEWSNKYYFSGPAPSTGGAWDTMIDALADKERAVYASSVQVVRAYGYTDGAQDSVHTRDYVALSINKVGTFVSSGAPATPGDAAAWVRWATSKRNSKGKVVYLRKYYHGVFEGSPADNVLDAQKTAYGVLATALAGGTGSISGFTLCGPDGTAAGANSVGPYITTRTLKRRGKRPPS